MLGCACLEVLSFIQNQHIFLLFGAYAFIKNVTLFFCTMLFIISYSMSFCRFVGMCYLIPQNKKYKTSVVRLRLGGISFSPLLIFLLISLYNLLIGGRECPPTPVANVRLTPSPPGAAVRPLGRECPPLSKRDNSFPHNFNLSSGFIDFIIFTMSHLGTSSSALLEICFNLGILQSHFLWLFDKNKIFFL